MIKLLIKTFLVLGIMSGTSLNLAAQEAGSFGKEEYQIWAKVLEEHVDDQGQVNYDKLKSNRADLDAFIEQVRFASISAMSENEKKSLLD